MYFSETNDIMEIYIYNAWANRSKLCDNLIRKGFFIYFKIAAVSAISSKTGQHAVIKCLIMARCQPVDIHRRMLELNDDTYMSKSTS